MTPLVRQPLAFSLLLLLGVCLLGNLRGDDVFNRDSSESEPLISPPEGPTTPTPPTGAIAPSLLQNAIPFNAETENVIYDALLAMALRDDRLQLAKLQQIFETYPERRHLVAEALAEYALRKKRRRPQQWRLLVRSLRLVEGRRAALVMRALQTFRQRATKPEHLRQVILLGVAAPVEGGPAAIALLEHWASHHASSPTDSPAVALQKWQAWFEAKYPETAAPRAAESLPDEKYSYAALRAFVYSPAGARGDAARGALAFKKADCQKCHRVGQFGETLGPELTEISGRLQRKEIVRAVLFPSKLISDQFFTYTVVTTNGQSYTGVVGDIGGGKIAVLQNNGEKVEIAKGEIEASRRNKQSAMPRGTFDRLTLAEIADLFAFLEKRGAE